MRTNETRQSYPGVSRSEFHVRCLRIRFDSQGVVVVRLFIGTQNRLVALHSALIKAHEEAGISPRSVIYRPVGSTMQLVTKLSSPNFAVLQVHRYLEPSILGVTETLRVKRQHPNSQLPHTSNSVQNCALSPTPLCSSMM